MFVATVAIGAQTYGWTAQLTVSSGDVSQYTDVDCTDDVLSVTVSGGLIGASRNGVVVSNIPVSSQNLSFEVALSNSSGNLLASGTATCTAATCTISTGTYNAPSVTDADMLVDTWGIDTDWDGSCTWFFLWFCA